MKNIVLTGCDRAQLEYGTKILAVSRHSPCAFSLLCLQDGGELSILNFDESLAVVSSIPVPLDPVEKHVKFVEYFEMAMRFVLFTSSGEIFGVSDSGDVEPVGTIDGGILAAEISSDLSLLCIVSALGKVLLLTSDFDQICESHIHISGTGGACLSWRADSEYFAVKDDNAIMVFDRNGRSVSQTVEAGLSDHISWRPSGELICCPQTLPSGRVVSFFERNGLKRSDFSVERDTLSVDWSSDSTLLLVRSHSSIALYYRSNYHWYKKYSIDTAPFDCLQSAGFSANRPKNVFIHTTDSFYSLSFDFAIFSTAKYSTVCVVDGSKILSTPFELQNIPPPGSTFVTECNHPVRFVCQTEDGFGVLTDKAFSTFLLENNMLSMSNSVSLETIPCELLVRQCHLRNDKLLIQCDNLVDGSPNVVSLDVGQGTIDHITEMPTRHKWLSGYLSSGDQVAIDDADSIDTAAKFSVNPLSDLAYEPSPRSVALPNPTTCQSHVVGLDAAALVADDRKISDMATSFGVHPQFLLFTTLEHELCAVSWTDLTQNNALHTTERRKIEIGAEIIVVCEKNASVVLQMPRGNLETVYPRPLVVHQIRECLRADDYGTAFSICRRHRVDNDILIEDCGRFNPELFVAQVSNPDFLNVFLSSIKDSSKINRVCLDIRTALLKNIANDPTSCSRMLEPVMTSFVRQKPADISSALSMLKSIDSSMRHKHLKYLLFLVDPDKVYREALGMYEFDLAIAIARRTQKDPKEYIPYIESLCALSPDEMRFRVNCDLERYSEALRHLCAIPNNIENVIEFVKKHALYIQAIAIYETDRSEYSQMQKTYAEHLELTNQHRHAGLSYMVAGERESALRCMISALAAHEAMSLAAEIGQTKSSARELVGRLAKENQFELASEIADLYLENAEEAVKLLLEARMYAKAEAVASRRNRLDLLETDVNPTSLSHAEAIISESQMFFNELCEHSQRILEIRNEKANALSALDTNAESGQPDWELLTEASFMTATTASVASSSFSRSNGSMTSSGGTSRRERKAAKPKLRKRRGGRYEHAFLMDQCREIAAKSNILQTSVKSLILHLLGKRNFGVSGQLQQSFDRLENKILEILPIIFADGVVVDPPIEKPTYEPIAWRVPFV